MKSSILVVLSTILGVSLAAPTNILPREQHAPGSINPDTGAAWPPGKRAESNVAHEFSPSAAWPPTPDEPGVILSREEHAPGSINPETGAAWPPGEMRAESNVAARKFTPSAAWPPTPDEPGVVIGREIHAPGSINPETGAAWPPGKRAESNVAHEFSPSAAWPPGEMRAESNVARNIPPAAWPPSDDPTVILPRE